MTTQLDNGPIDVMTRRWGRSIPPLAPDRRRLAALEVVLAVSAVLLDLLVPALVLVLLAAASLAGLRETPASLGFRRPTRRHLLLGTALVASVWSIAQLSLTMPLTSRISGERQDFGVFADVEGDLGLLVLLVLLSWTLGALAEETAFRGFLLTRMGQALGAGPTAVVTAALASSLLFGLVHSEQGAVGVVAITLDGLVFCALRLHYGTLWAPVLAHGLNNTLGLIAFYLVGPIHGLW